MIKLPSSVTRTAISNTGSGSLCSDRPQRWHSPTLVGFLGLIVAIVLWGTAYKLSLYHPHPAPSTRNQVAKLWLETRVSYAVSLREIKEFPKVRTDADALAVHNPPSAGLIEVLHDHHDVAPKNICTAILPMPSRPPPSLSLCLG